MLTFRHQLWGLRMGLLKISLRSWWKSWVCVRWLQYLQITIEFNSQHCFPLEIHVHSICQHWLKNMLLMKMWELKLSIPSPARFKQALYFFFLWNLTFIDLDYKNTKWVKWAPRLQWQIPVWIFFMKPPILVKNTACRTACHALING